VITNLKGHAGLMPFSGATAELQLSALHTNKIIQFLKFTMHSLLSSSQLQTG